MRILWLSRPPWAAGGYSNQTALFAPRLAAAGHQVAIAAFQGISSGTLEWRGLTVYPLIANDPRALSVIGLHYQHWRADLLVSLHDGNRIVDGTLLARRFPRLRWALCCPIDAEALPAALEKNLHSCAVAIAISRFGERVARAAGVDARYVPHGVDTAVFAPLDRAAARARLGWPQDAFICGMVAANDGTRKAFPQHIQGFAAFLRQRPGARLYLHTEATAPGGVDLATLCTEVGLRVGEDVLFCDPYRYLLSYPDPDLAAIYSALDVLLSATKGEGFGIPIVEAQACGTPVIVGDWSAMSELCFAGWKIGREESAEVENHWRLAAPEAIADRLATACAAGRDPARRAALAAQARAGALTYDADRVLAESWLPLLAGLGAPPGGDGA